MVVLLGNEMAVLTVALKDELSVEKLVDNLVNLMGNMMVVSKVEWWEQLLAVKRGKMWVAEKELTVVEQLGYLLVGDLVELKVKRLAVSKVFLLVEQLEICLEKNSVVSLGK
jgi:PIN domain nuclease of toxin-antitoxin system